MAKDKRNTTTFKKVVITHYYIETGNVYFEEPVSQEDGNNGTTTSSWSESVIYYPKGFGYDSPTLTLYTYPNVFFRVSEFLVARFFNSYASDTKIITLGVVNFGEKFVTVHPASYMFVAFSSSAPPDLLWEVVSVTKSLTHFVRYPLPYKQDPVLTPLGEVKQFLHRCAVHQMKKGKLFSVGDLVMVPKLGVTGVIEQKRGDNKYKVKVEMFNSTVTVEVLSEDIYPF